MHLGKKLSRTTSLVVPEIPVNAVELAEALGMVVINAAGPVSLPIGEQLELPAAPVETPLADVLRKVEAVRRG
ncbi:MAG: hypothetical protein AB7L13_23870 [Acidimicrobiia bacterium]